MLFAFRPSLNPASCILFAVVSIALLTASAQTETAVNVRLLSLKKYFIPSLIACEDISIIIIFSLLLHPKHSCFTHSHTEHLHKRWAGIRVFARVLRVIITTTIIVVAV